MFYIIVLYYIVWSYLHSSYQSNIMDITQYVPVLPWCKNQSFDLHSKWCLYEGNTGT